jgi:hypothetical protein
MICGFWTGTVVKLGAKDPDDDDDDDDDDDKTGFAVQGG